MKINSENGDSTAVQPIFIKNNKILLADEFNFCYSDITLCTFLLIQRSKWLLQLSFPSSQGPGSPTSCPSVSPFPLDLVHLGCYNKSPRLGD